MRPREPSEVEFSRNLAHSSMWSQSSCSFTRADACEAHGPAESGAGSSALDAEAYRSGCEPQLIVVRGERKILESTSNEQRARQVDRVERSEHRWEGLGGALEDGGGDRDEAEPLDDVQDDGPSLRDYLVLQPERQPSTVQGTKALQPDELARNSLGDPSPYPKTPRLPQHDAEQHRGVHIDVQRRWRSSRRSCVEVTLHRTGL